MNLLLPQSIPNVTLHLGDFLPIPPMDDILMTKEATHQPNQYTVFYHHQHHKCSLTAPTTITEPSSVRQMLFCSLFKISVYSLLVMVHCTK